MFAQAAVSCRLETRRQNEVGGTNLGGHNPNAVTYIHDVYFSGTATTQKDCVDACDSARAKASDGEITSCTYNSVEVKTYSGPKNEDAVDQKDTTLSNSAQNYWTCYMKIDNKIAEVSPVTENPSPIASANSTSRCVNLRTHGGSGVVGQQINPQIKNSIQTEDEARAVCYTICAQQTSPGRVVSGCKFIRSIACKNDTDLDIKDYILLTQADNQDLKLAVGEIGRLSSFTSVPRAIGSLVTAAVGVLGSIAFAFYIYAGLTWMTARGNSEKTEQAGKILVWTTLGICMVLGSYILTDFVLQGFIK